MSSKEIRKKLHSLKDSEQAKLALRYFKTGKGEYSEDDIFLGIRMPELRQIAKEYYIEISYSEIDKIFNSKFHEERLLAALLLLYKTKLADKQNDLNELKRSYQSFKKNIKFINNWDLVDVCCRDVVGAYCYYNSNTDQLYKWAVSKDLWKRRIAIVSTYYLIKRDRCEDTYKLSLILLNDKEDLMHKAVGWMLREAAKRSLKDQEKFMKKHYKNMPRTMLRYAIEHFEESKRKKYLQGKI